MRNEFQAKETQLYLNIINQVCLSTALDVLFHGNKVYILTLRTRFR